MQAQRRKADQGADPASEHGGQREINEERHAMQLHEARGVGADGQEGRVAERRLAGEAGKDHQRHAHDGVDEDEHDLALQVVADQEGTASRTSNSMP